MKAAINRLKVDAPKAVAELQAHVLSLLHKSSLHQQNVNPAWKVETYLMVELFNYNLVFTMSPKSKSIHSSVTLLETIQLLVTVSPEASENSIWRNKYKSENM